MTADLLSIRNLSVKFELGDSTITAVNDISLNVGKAEIVALVGESGSGKSVTSQAISKLLPREAECTGSIEFIGFHGNILTQSERKLRRLRGRRITYVFQEPATSFNPVFTVGSQLMEVLALNGVPKSQRFTRAVSLLENLGIEAPAKRLSAFPSEFSGGMLQRLALAVALAPSPDLIIADEPTTALDASSKLNIIRIFRKIRQDFGTAILFITHDLGCLPHFADRVYVMQNGLIVEAGTTKEILYHPQAPYTKNLVNAVPRLKANSHTL